MNIEIQENMYTGIQTHIQIGSQGYMNQVEGGIQVYRNTRLQEFQ